MGINKIQKKIEDLYAIEKFRNEAMYLLARLLVQEISKEELISHVSKGLDTISGVDWKMFAIDELVNIGFVHMRAEITEDSAFMFCPFYLKDVFFPDEEVKLIAAVLEYGWPVEGYEVQWDRPQLFVGARPLNKS